MPKLVKIPKREVSTNGSIAKVQLGKSLSRREATRRKEPLWAGPESNADNGGVTQSLLGRFLVCRERFRLLVVEGLKESDGYNHRIEYGNMWHVCEEAIADRNRMDWDKELLEYCQQLAKHYKNDQREIEKWYNICKMQFPLYLKRWTGVKQTKALFQETPFKVQYKLPSGRVVYLRGKMDRVDLEKKTLILQENKAKGEVDKEKILRELPFDLQTNLYLVALHCIQRDHSNLSYKVGMDGCHIGSVRYNVIKRPLSGRGEGNIRKREGRGKAKVGAETDAEFYTRIGSVIEENMGEFFFRFNMEVSERESAAFQQRSLDPILEQLCDWWEYISLNPFAPWDITGDDMRDYSPEAPPHFLMPYGIWSPLLEGRTGPLDDYMATGDEAGLTRTDSLFRELA